MIKKQWKENKILKNKNGFKSEKSQNPRCIFFLFLFNAQMKYFLLNDTLLFLSFTICSCSLYCGQVSYSAFLGWVRDTQRMFLELTKTCCSFLTGSLAKIKMLPFYVLIGLNVQKNLKVLFPTRAELCSFFPAFGWVVMLKASFLKHIFWVLIHKS